MTQSKTKNKGKENEGRPLFDEKQHSLNTNSKFEDAHSPLKSEFKTSEKNKLISEGYRWSTIFHKGMGFRIAEDEDDLHALALTMRDIQKLWLSKEDYEKRVEEFRKKICMCFKQDVQPCFECNLINKILLGRK